MINEWWSKGTTVNVGPNETNLPSRNRAAAVRDYLITRGIDPNKVSLVGFGSTKPLVDNTNSENRANNRRVEIIIQPTSKGPA